MTGRRGRRIAAPLVLITAAFGAAGCGGDSSGETTPSITLPAVTAPSVTATTAPAATVRPGTTTGKARTNYDPSQPDSPTNDVPPPAGSPEEAFEKQCEQNPQACG